MLVCLVSTTLHLSEWNPYSQRVIGRPSNEWGRETFVTKSHAVQFVSCAKSRCASPPEYTTSLNMAVTGIEGSVICFHGRVGEDQSQWRFHVVHLK